MGAKICYVCKLSKSTAEFNKHKRQKDGLEARCRDCRKKYYYNTQQRRKNYNKKYYRTKRGHLIKIYNAMIFRCKGQQPKNLLNYYSVKIKMSKEEFITWSLNRHDFEEAYQIWMKCGYDKLYTPSIDRVDSDLHYSFDNMQWLTFKAHVRKTHIERGHDVKT